MAYGYDVVKKFNANGEPIRRDRKINEKQDIWAKQRPRNFVIQAYSL